MHKRNASACVIFKAVNDVNKTRDEFLPCETIQCSYSYPLKLVIPRECHGCNTVCSWIYPLVFGGGFVENDKIQIQCDVGSKCCVLWTSLSYPKVYSCASGLQSYQEYQFTVDAKGFLCILGDPIQCFKQACFVQRQEFQLHSGANFVLLDWAVSGRIERGERWDFTSYKNVVNVYVDGKLVCREHQHMHNTEHLNVKSIMKAYNIIGMCLILGPYLSEFSSKVLKEFSKTDAYDSGLRSYPSYPGGYATGERRKSETLFAVSPVYVDDEIHGCMIKFSAESVTEVYKELDRIFKPLHTVLGGNPFEHKY